MTGRDQHPTGAGRPPGAQLHRLFGVVEHQQPAVPLPEGVPQRTDGLGLVGRLGEAEPAGKRGQLGGDRGGLLGGHPPDQVVVGAVTVGVLERELGLAHPTQPMQRLRLNLDDRGGLPWVQGGV